MTKVVMSDKFEVGRGALNVKPLLIICALLVLSMICGVLYDGPTEDLVAEVVSAKPAKYMEGHLPETEEVVEDPDMEITVIVSRYNPELGGVNCFDYRNGGCQSPMANGERWEPYFEIAIACPSNFPFETKMEIDGRVWICKDRGGKIVEDGGAYWIDMLSRVSHYPFGTRLPAKVWLP